MEVQRKGGLQKQSERQKERDRVRNRQRDRDTQTETEGVWGERETYRHTDTQREIMRERLKQRHWEIERGRESSKTEKKAS